MTTRPEQVADVDLRAAMAAWSALPLRDFDDLTPDGLMVAVQAARKVYDDGSMDFRTAQAAVWQNKLDKGFNTTDVRQEFRYLMREYLEALRAWRLGLPDVDLELADVVLFASSLAEILGIDLGDAVARKLAINAARTYVRGPRGRMVRVDAPASQNGASHA